MEALCVTAIVTGRKREENSGNEQKRKPIPVKLLTMHEDAICDSSMQYFLRELMQFAHNQLIFHLIEAFTDSFIFL